MNNLSERLNHALKVAGITQSELARRIGIKQQSINQICSGKSARSRYTTQIADAICVNSHWLATGEGDIGMGLENLESGPAIQGKIPLINWVQASCWAQIRKGFASDDAEEWREFTGKVHKGCFALRVKGDSMENPNGKKSIPEGAVVIVEPDATYSSGSFVVARLENATEATLKQFVIDGDHQFLKPLNPQYPAIPIDDNCTIIGVVKQAVIDF